MPYVVKDKILFLSSASKILSSSLDYHMTLKSIGELVVESVADFCTIDILENGKLQRVVVRMSDRKKDIEAQKFYDFPSDPKNKNATYDTMKLGKPIIIKKVNNKWINSVSKIREERELMKKINFSSFMFTPLQSRGQVIGVMTIGSIQKGFVYSDADAVFIKELADRAGITIDKAKLYTEAREAIRIRDEFLSIASHELKTPLTSILLSLQLILRRLEKNTHKFAESEEIFKAVEISITQSKRMSRLINDLLDVSLITSDYFQIDPEEVNLTGLLKDVEMKFEVILKHKKIDLVIKEAQENVTGYWDRVRIEQVISNLISNALKYGNGKPILIKTELQKDHVLIKVKDRGIGIRPEDKDRIFKVFNRGLDVKSYKGIGVGLFISKKIVDAHKGELIVNSSLGNGSTFIVKLPVKN